MNIPRRPENKNEIKAHILEVFSFINVNKTTKSNNKDVDGFMKLNKVG